MKVLCSGALCIMSRRKNINHRLVATHQARVIRSSPNNFKFMNLQCEVLFTNGDFSRQLAIFPATVTQLIHSSSDGLILRDIRKKPTYDLMFMTAQSGQNWTIHGVVKNSPFSPKRLWSKLRKFKLYLQEEYGVQLKFYKIAPEQIFWTDDTKFGHHVQCHVWWKLNTECHPNTLKHLWSMVLKGW